MSRAELAAYPIAVGLAEGGWVAVVYLLVDAVARVDAPLGLGVFAIVAGMTCALADRLDRLATTRLAVIVGLLVGGGLLGMAITAARLVAAGGIDPGQVLTGDPGAVLIGLAALRGFIRAGAIRDPSEAARPIFVGLIGLSFAWVFGGVLGEPMRSAFRDAALIPTVAFVVGGLVAAALARSALAASEVAFDPLANRSWLIVLIGATTALGLAALPGGVTLERLMAAVIAWPGTLPLVIVIAFIARIVVPSRKGLLRRTGAFTLGPLLFLAAIALVAALLPRATTTPGSDQPAGSAAPGSEATTPLFELLLAVVAISLVVGVLVFLARAWRRNTSALGPHRRAGRDERGYRWTDADEQGAGRSASRWGRLTRRGRPVDAVAAYLAALRVLEPDPELRREPAESPAAHAHRLREAGIGTLDLDLLAADFELARWGGRRLTPTEDRRAIRRWERLRDRILGRPAGDGAPRPADG